MKNLTFLLFGFAILCFSALSHGQEVCNLEDVNIDKPILAIAECLGEHDPVIREKAYDGLVTLLRGGGVSGAVTRDLLQKCTGFLQSGDDESGFLKPYAALCITEVARTDRIAPHFNEGERANIVKTATAYLKSITDYRGFDDVEGWRHGVAHTADVLMQLSLNDQINIDHHHEMLAAIASQISPQDHFYIYGEPVRLARPVMFMAMQGKISEQEWSNWFADISNPTPEMENWNEAFSSNAGLAKRHNLTAFLSALQLNTSTSDNENLKAIMPGLTAALQRVP